MNIKKQKWLIYLGLTLLLIFFLIGIPMMGFRSVDPFALFIVAVTIIIFITSMKFSLSKGNISNYNLNNLNLIWKDDVISPPKSKKDMIKKIKMSGIVLFVLITILIILTPKINSFISLKMKEGFTDSIISPLMFAYVFLILGCFIAFLFFIVEIISYKLKKKGRLPNQDFSLYAEGVKYLNYFIKWKDIKSINYPSSFKASQKTAKFLTPFVLMNSLKWGAATTGTVLGTVSSGTTTKITDINDKVYIVEIINKDGFKQALIKLNKQNLIK